jgi:hypothetical protein
MTQVNSIDQGSHVMDDVVSIRILMKINARTEGGRRYVLYEPSFTVVNDVL